jgi:hypothetical protein
MCSRFRHLALNGGMKKVNINIAASCQTKKCGTTDFQFVDTNYLLFIDIAKRFLYFLYWVEIGSFYCVLLGSFGFASKDISSFSQTVIS